MVGAGSDVFRGQACAAQTSVREPGPSTGFLLPSCAAARLSGWQPLGGLNEAGPKAEGWEGAPPQGARAAAAAHGAGAGYCCVRGKECAQFDHHHEHLASEASSAVPWRLWACGLFLRWGPAWVDALGVVRCGWERAAAAGAGPPLFGHYDVHRHRAACLGLRQGSSRAIFGGDLFLVWVVSLGALTHAAAGKPPRSPHDTSPPSGTAPFHSRFAPCQATSRHRAPHLQHPERALGLRAESLAPWPRLTRPSWPRCAADAEGRLWCGARRT